MQHQEVGNSQNDELIPPLSKSLSLLPKASRIDNINIDIPSSNNYNANNISINSSNGMQPTTCYDEPISIVLPNFGRNNNSSNDDASAANTLTTTDFVTMSNHNDNNFGGEVFDFSDINFFPSSPCSKENDDLDSGSLSSLDVGSLSEDADACSFSETC